MTMRPCNPKPAWYQSAQQRREQQPRHGAFLENSLVVTDIGRETLDHNKLPRAPWTSLMNDRLSAMRCLFCNAEMVLMEAVQADPTTLPSFEHRTFLCPACHRVERRSAYVGAGAPSAAPHSGASDAKLNTGRTWGRVVEKVISKQVALNERAKCRPGSATTADKPVSRHGGVQERPSPAKTIELVSELNRIWDDPHPAADKRFEPPATSKAE